MSTGSSPSHEHRVPPSDMARDPVCGMSVDPKSTPHHAAYGGESFHFCCDGCRARFVASPEDFLHPTAGAGADVAADTVAAGAERAEYTCPMHPEVRQLGPGACPLCGMSLEPVAVSAESPASGELTDLSRRLWFGVALVAPLLVLEMSRHLGFGPHGWPMPRALGWIECLLGSPVVLWSGAPLWRRGWASVRHRSPNMFTLIALGVAAAYLDSLAAIFVPQWFPPALRGAGGALPVYFEPAAVITVLVLLGQVLELRARERTGGAIRALLALAPKRAHRLRAGGDEEEVALDRIEVGDRLRILPGESVPVDGEVLEGRSGIDESMVTGESMPLEKGPGARVIGGTINGTGSLVMRAQQVGVHTLLARIVQRVAEAQRSRAPIQRLADTVSGWFVPAVIVAALAAFVCWLELGPAPAFAYALVAAVSVLIIACPCALGLATPMSVMVGIGRAAGLGILIKDAEALERFEQVDTLVVDKTGTLTEGRPRVIGLVPANAGEDSALLQRAASLERHSEHPLAGAIVAAAAERALAALPVSDFRSITGQGVTGRVGGATVAVGTEGLLEGLGVSVASLQPAARQWSEQAASVLYVAVDGLAAGLIALSDPIKATTPSALERLRAQGVRVVMLTGDGPAVARSVAARLGIAEFEAGVSPDRKYEAVGRLRAQGRVVAMAGDGINDAPALAAADVGIAMGTGTEVAMQSAAITLVKGDLAGIARARALSRATMRNIRQNLLFAFAYNVLGIPLAAGVLYPAFGLLLSPVIAAAAMSLSSVSVIGNALRLRAARV